MSLNEDDRTSNFNSVKFCFTLIVLIHCDTRNLELKILKNSDKPSGFVSRHVSYGKNLEGSDISGF